MRTKRILLFLLAVAVLGLSVFGSLVWRATTVEHADRPDALQRFSDVRATFRPALPMLQVDASGQLIRHEHQPAAKGPRPTQLDVLAYRAREQRLVRVDIPFWFFKLKGVAVQIALRGTGLDMERLEVTPADLEQHGPGVVLDETRANGDRLLVWTE